MEDPSRAIFMDPNAGLSTILSHFDLLEFNSLFVGHFYHFEASYSNFLRFSMPLEGLPLLKELLKVHGDFISLFRVGVFLGNILLELLYVVLISLKSALFDSLSKEKLLEWRGVVQNLVEVKFNLSFLLGYFRSVADAFFQMRATKDHDAGLLLLGKP